MFAEVNAGKHTCWANTARYDNSTIVLLSLFGTSNIVRACGAHLSGKHQHIEVVGWEDWLRLGDASYARCHKSLGDDQHHMVMVDRRATITGSAWDPTLYLVANSKEGASKDWLQRFASRCKVPLRPSWGPRLWQAGVEEGAIRELEGFGMLCYSLYTDEVRWLRIVGDLVRQGELK